MLSLFGVRAKGHGKHRTADVLGVISSTQKEFTVGKSDGNVAAEQQQDRVVRSLMV